MSFKRCNFVFALSATVPLLVVLGLILYLENYNIWYCILIVLTSCLSFILSFRKIRKTTEQPYLVFKINSVNLATREIFGSFIAYILPLAFGISGSNNVIVISFACLLYCFLVTISNTVYPSWIFPLLGYRLYRIKTESGLEALMLSDQYALNVLTQTTLVVELDDCCYIDVTSKHSEKE